MARRQLNFLKYKMRFGERDSGIDADILTEVRCRPCWQMVLYQLTTDGSMDFEHIDDVAPWIKNEAYERSETARVAFPRIIKSHDTYDSFEHTQGRFIFIMRDGRGCGRVEVHRGGGLQ
ncbi:MAG: hypothetical protein U5L96_20720 [Owenweeksia sp.]|nr:hypothetical protein [Owenweeksia sp.]